ncbi:ATP-binding protein [bacterium]|nr:ATP-binding protein [bacterium]
MSQEMTGITPELLSLLEIRKILVSHHNLVELFEGFRDFINQHFGSRNISLILFDAASGKKDTIISFPSTFENDPESAYAFFARWVWQNQEPIIIQDTKEETHFADQASLLQQQGICSFLSFPLTTAKRKLGALILWSRQPNAYNNFQLDFGSLIAAEISIVVDNVLHSAELDRANESLKRETEERSGLEKALRESEERYYNIVKMQSEMVCRYLPDTTLTFVNEAYCRYFGKNREELIGTKFLLLIPEEFREVARQHVESLIKKPRIERDEHPVTNPDGRLGWQQWVDSVVLDDQGKVKELQAVGWDITERKLAEDALDQTSDQLARVARASTMGELTASIAHEVNQPLTAIINNGNACLRWLATDSPNLNEIREAVKDIIKDGNRASDVISRIRMLLTKKPLQPVAVDPNVVINDVTALMQNECERNKVRMRIELESGLPEVLGDRVELQQVILNLIMNGIEAMSSLKGDRILEISSQRQPSGDVMITVSDNGEGLDQQMGNQLFEPFFTTKPQGLGIGLSISRSIIEAHGGKLWAVTKQKPGATFSFTLPAKGQY